MVEVIRSSRRVLFPAGSRTGRLAVMIFIALARTVAAGGPGDRRLPVGLRSLPVGAAALMVGAHPDDEDSALLAELALRRGVRTTYLSLTRGEGGQNRIGGERGTALGLLRTGELLAARRFDGASQLLGPFIDFGFSKSARETFERWGRESMVAVIVRAIRQTRADVVISIWSGEPSDGHGHHRACGEATLEAFELAGRSDALAGQLESGLSPWRPARLVVRDRRAGGPERPDPGAIRIDVGRWDPVLDRSPLEIAMEGRSLHRSQDMGALRPRGSHRVRYRVAAGEAVAGGSVADVFAGLPVSLSGWAAARLSALEALPLDVRDSMRAPTTIQRAVDQAALLLEYSWELYHPARPQKTALALEKSLGALRSASGMCLPSSGAPSGAGGGENRPSAALGPAIRQGLEAIQERIGARRRDAAELWARASGVAIDVLSSSSELSAGESVEVEVEVHARGATPLALAGLEVTVAEPLEWRWITDELPGVLAPGESSSRLLELSVPRTPQSAERAVTLSLAPWLRVSQEADRYGDPGGPPGQGLDLRPRAAPLLAVSAVFRAGDEEVRVTRPVEYRFVDPGLGEVRRPLRVVPELEVEIAPGLIVVPVGSEGAVAGRVTVRSHVDRPTDGRLVVRGGAEPAMALVDLGPRTLDGDGSSLVIPFELPLDLSRVGAHSLIAEWQPAPAPSGPVPAMSRAIVEVDHSHIQATYHFREARLEVMVVDVAVADGLAIGYIPGAPDGIPEALGRLGVEPEIIDVEFLRGGDLGRFSAIVVGVRALEIREELLAHRDRIWDYAREGGTVVVQYHKPSSDGPRRFVPFDGVSMTRPAARVTDEGAEVTFLATAHPLLVWPNRLGPADFDGWVQERGLYFLSSWPDELTPLLECGDPGEPGRRGGLLSGKVGAGRYVYCAYALFRQLPAGVPGAYRLLANLVSWSGAP